MSDALDPLEYSRREWEDPERTRRLRVPKALEDALEGKYILCPEYMRSYVALEGKGEPPRTGPEVGRAPEVDLERRMYQAWRSPLGGNIRGESRVEGTAGSVSHRPLRTRTQAWEQAGECTSHDENLCAHLQV